MNKSTKGFTLIEVMIVLVIVAILSSIAWPLYENYSRKNIRGQAVAMLSHLRLEMERCASNNNGSYVGCELAGVGLPMANVTTVIGRQYSDIYYNLNIQVPNPGTGTGYLVTATEVTGNDEDCVTLTIDDLGNKGFTEVMGANSNTTRCWGSN